MIEVRAPGKLFIAGEYAVVEPGEPAILVAVDRYLAVRVSETEGAGTVHSPEYSRLPLVWTRGADGLTLDREHHPYEYVMSVLSVVERLRDERGIAPRFFDLRIDSELDDVSGRKFGLGSSAAVTVATVGALDAFYGLGLSRVERCKLALLATVAVSPAASGGDLAASTYGGWIRYSAPDRGVLAAALAESSVSAVLADDAAWAGFDVVRLTPPAHLRLLVGWTGSPASTQRLVDDVQRRRDDIDYDGFLAESRGCVDRLADSLSRGDDAGALAALRGARSAIRGLGEATGLAIETERLGELVAAAEAAGAAAKSSGAGGGDCGIVLAPESAALADMLRVWEAHDIRHLTISVHPAEGGDDD